ncbi:MAG: hypothetical protein KF764_14000 [Labilithrix sp.]|nr:hypothetical protein [Labilithrix sp.]
MDFAVYARLFVGLPILVASDMLVGTRLRTAGLQFVRGDFIRREDVPAFERAVARLARSRDSVVATIVLVSLAALGAWTLTIEAVNGVGTGGWRSVMLPEGHALRYSLAALWNHLVAVPVVLFLLYRWLWRILIWTVFLVDVARLDLQLVPTHADKAGGLGFLEVAHESFAGIAFAMGAVISAGAAFRVVYEGAALASFGFPLVVLVTITQLLFLGPLLVFCPALARSRRTALASYGALVDRYNRAFQGKWIGEPPADERLLGSPDIQSLADLGNSFRFVHEMGITPFGRRAVLQLAFAATIPLAPLLLLVVPTSQIVGTLLKLVL